MASRKVAIPLLLLSILVLASGCLISNQEGERTHVNSKPPDEISR
jgi:hypothetical protein